MKKLSSLLFAVIFLSPVAFAADGAKNSTIISTLENSGAVIGMEGSVKTGMVGASVDSGGETTVGTIKLKGSVNNSKIITKVKNKGVVTCIGNATCGSVTYDFTN